MERARSTLVVPGDPTLPTALAAHSDPPISVARSSETVVEFGSAIGDIMLRSRVVQALELAVGRIGRPSPGPLDSRELLTPSATRFAADFGSC
jgi:hypothetical protein